MKAQSRLEKKYAAIILIIALAMSLLASISLICFAEGEYNPGSPLHRKLSEEKSIRRAARKSQQRKLEEEERKDTSRDTSRLDYKIAPSTVKITDAKISDQKDWAFEMKREREEAKLDEEKVLGPVRSAADHRIGSKEFLAEKERRSTFF